MNGEQILGGKQFPVISAGSQGKVILPASMKASGNLLKFTTTNDAYVTPVPSEHLLKQGKLVLAEPLDAVQTDIRIRKSELFAVPLTLNGLQIGKELISFGFHAGEASAPQ